MGLVARKTSLRGFRKSDFQTGLLSYIDWLEIEISPDESLHIILSEMRIAKKLFRLHGFAG